MQSMSRGTEGFFIPTFLLGREQTWEQLKIDDTCRNMYVIQMQTKQKLCTFSGGTEVFQWPPWQHNQFFNQAAALDC